MESGGTPLWNARFVGAEVRGVPAAVKLGPLRLPVFAIAWGSSIAIHAGIFGSAYWASQYASAPTDRPAAVLLQQGEHAKEFPVKFVEPPDTSLDLTASEKRELQLPPIRARIDKDRIDQRVPNLDFKHTFIEYEVDHQNQRLDKWLTEIPETKYPTITTFASKSRAAVATLSKEQSTEDIAMPGPPDQSAKKVQYEGVTVGVRLLHLPSPRYPAASRRLGEEGLVVLRVEVLANGNAGDIEVIEHPGYDRLVRAAIETARKASYEPATRDGAAVAGYIRIPIRFEFR